MNVLFVCSANKDRSVTAEELAYEQWPKHHYLSAGTNQKLCFNYHTQFINEELLKWADIVFAMENKHKEQMLRLFGNSYSKRVAVLGIRDHYEFGNTGLKELLSEKLQAYL